MESEKKSIFASKTFWANIIAGAATLLTVFGFDLGLDETTQAELVAGVMVAVNIVLRFVTKEPVSITGGTSQ